MKKFLSGLINKTNPTCPKSLIGLLGSLSLIIAMFIWHTDTLIESVLILTLGSLSITGAESIFARKNTTAEPKIKQNE